MRGAAAILLLLLGAAGGVAQSFEEHWTAIPAELSATGVAQRVPPVGPVAPKAQPQAAPKAQPQAAPKAQPQAQATPSGPVSLEQALYLIRATLLTLNDANRSGNYTVLRDLAAPGFQTKNNAAELGVIFADLRRRRIDLFAAALMVPQLAAAPVIDANGMLRLTGHFPTQPLQIRFDLLFQNVEQRWLLFGISVATPEAPQASLPAASR
jgi:hypothetical protein